MFRLVYIIFISFFISIQTNVADAADHVVKEFDQRTLQELVTGSEKTFREFGINNLKMPETMVFIENIVIPKHCKEMYFLWKHANNWEAAGTLELKETRDNLQQTIAHILGSQRAKQLIKGKLKDKSFLFVSLNKKGIKDKALLTVQNGRMKIEKDLTGGGYDIIFEHKFDSDVGITQEKEFQALEDPPVLSQSHGAKVLVVIIGMYEFLDLLWQLTETSGMATENEALELLKTHPGRIKSIYAIRDYTF